MFRIEETRAETARAARSPFLLLALTVLAVPAMADGPHPLEVAAHFLALTEEQVAGVVAIEQALQEAVAPVVQQIVQSRAELEELIASAEPDPTDIGTVVLAIRALEQQVAGLRQEATAQLHELLDANQLERLRTASEARPLCRILPALGALHLL